MLKRQFEVHPVASIFPMMSEAEYQGLKQDIAENGQEEPIVVWQGQLIDGRNRLKACEELGIEPDWVELDEEADPVKYVISHNLHRRHLDESQRAMVGARLRKVFDDEAKERQGTRTDIVENLPQSSKGRSRDKAGEAVAVSGKSVDAATKVLTQGSPELAEMVDRGEVKVSKAATLVKKVKSKEKQTEIISQGPAAIKEATKPEVRRDPLEAIKKQIQSLEDGPADQLYRWMRHQQASAESDGYVIEDGPPLAADDVDLLGQLCESDNAIGVVWHWLKNAGDAKSAVVREFCWNVIEDVDAPGAGASS